MRSLRLALAFLTILPVGNTGPHREGDLARAAAWYPVVGLILGLLLSLLYLLTGGLPPGIRGGLLLAASFALTGMLHLDGWLDCADALLAPVGRERRLAILKDVSVGAFAFGAGAVLILLKWQALAELDSALPLISCSIAARSLVVLHLSHYRTARADGLGLAAARPESRLAWIGLLLALLLSPSAALGGLLLGALFTAWAARKLGGVTGDVHGATIELVETVGLLAAVAFA